MKMLAILAYFPVFGWFFPMFLGAGDGLCRYHARQGFAAFVFFTLCSAAAWLLSQSIPTFIGFVVHLMYAACVGSYVYLLVRGARVAVRAEEKPLPLIGMRAENLPL